MDSDVLLYTDASEDFKNYKNFIFIRIIRWKFLFYFKWYQKIL